MSTRLPAEQRRRQLLDIARDIFADRGFHATAMDDIAAIAGVTKPVLYQHFDNKRALFLELLDDVGEQLLLALSSAISGDLTGRARVEEGFAAYFRFVTANPAAFRLLFGAAVRNDPDFAQHAEAALDNAALEISKMIELPVDDEHRLLLAHAIVGMAEATSRRSIASEDAEDHPNAESLASRLAELAWFGLRGVRG